MTPPTHSLFLSQAIGNSFFMFKTTILFKISLSTTLISCLAFIIICFITDVILLLSLLLFYGISFNLNTDLYNNCYIYYIIITNIFFPF